MKINILLLFLTLSFSKTFAQQNDNVMVLGYRYGVNGPIPTLDFTYGSPDTGAYFSPIDVFEGNASICDSSGIMMMYTNGISLVNRYQQIIPGSDLFNSDQFNTAYNIYSYRIPQIAIIIPAPSQNGIYYIFHTGINIYPGNQIHPGVLSYSIVDMSLNTGSGQMILKNNPILSNVLSFSSLQAVKHANGRDWWVVVHEYLTNKFFSNLVTPFGIQSSIQSQTGPVTNTGLNGQSTFSPDGTKFAFADKDSNFLALYSFDRCDGIFTYDTIIRKTININGYNYSGCSFSPDNHFLYASNLLNLYQYDVTSSDVPSSEKLIATTDLFPDPFPSYFNQHCLGPDGKIYLSTGNSCAHLHVINEPNLADTNCNFVQHQQKIINYGNTVPTFPNYRLGALHNSLCDSLPTTVASTELLDRNLKIYPNPASINLNVELEYGNLQQQELKIMDLSGKLIFQSEFQIKTVVNISNFPNGIYFISVKSNNRIQYSDFTVMQ